MKESPNFASKYEHCRTVKADEIDEFNHVNNVVYLQWINDVSGLHWNTMAPEAIKEKYFWIVNRHEIDYLKPAFLGEEIKCQTWVETLAGVRSTRMVHIYRGDTLLAKAQTTWVLINAETNRLARIPENLAALFRK